MSARCRTRPTAVRAINPADAAPVTDRRASVIEVAAVADVVTVVDVTVVDVTVVDVVDVGGSVAMRKG